MLTLNAYFNVIQKYKAIQDEKSMDKFTPDVPFKGLHKRDKHLDIQRE